MKKYRITYSVTIEAESQQDAINILFDSVPQNGFMQCSECTTKKSVIGSYRGAFSTIGYGVLE